MPAGKGNRTILTPRVLRAAALVTMAHAALNSVLVPAAEPHLSVTVIDIHGREHVGDVQELNDKTIRLLGTARERLQTNDVIRIRFPHRQLDTDGSRLTVLLANSDRLRLHRVNTQNDDLIAETSAFGSTSAITIPLAAIDRLCWREIGRSSPTIDVPSPASEDRLKSDVVYLANGDHLEAEFLGLDADEVVMLSAGRHVRLPLSNVTMLAFNPLLISVPDPPEHSSLLTLTDGSRFTITHWELNDSRQLTFQTVYGLSLAVPVDRIATMQFLGGAIVYLSDMTPVEDQQSSYASGGWPTRRDCNVVGGPLRVRGIEHAKGLGVHSRSVLVYDLARRFQSFCAVVGVDDDSGRWASVVFVVEVDGRRLWHSDKLNQHSPPAATGMLDVADAERLTLTVEFGDYGDVQDRANWCDALLVHSQSQRVP